MGKQAKSSHTKNKKNISQPTDQEKLPVLTHNAYLTSVIAIISGFIIQIIIAIIIFGKLPQQIPTYWIGLGSVTQTMPSWVVFLGYPSTMIILYLIAFFSKKDADGNKVMDWGKSVSLILLAILFTALQGSAFTLIR